MLEWLPKAFIHGIPDPLNKILCAASAAFLDASVTNDSLHLIIPLCARAGLKRWRPVDLLVLVQLKDFEMSQLGDMELCEA